MKGVPGLLLLGVLGAGVLVGILAPGGIDHVSKASSAAGEGAIARTEGRQAPSKGDAASAGAAALDPRAQHRVRIVFDPGSPVTGVGIHGQCPPDDPPGTFPPEECIFTVEAVQYRRYEGGDPIKFTVVCVDTEHTGSDLTGSTCSPMEREPLAFGVGVSFAPAVDGEAGAAAGVFGAAVGSANVGPGFSVPFLVHRQLRYPLFRRYTGRAGGNILIESGIGSIVARQTVVFDHTPTIRVQPEPEDQDVRGRFDGNVRFFVTKPVGMDLTVGYVDTPYVNCIARNGVDHIQNFQCAEGIPQCQDLQGSELESCPNELTDALRYACNVYPQRCGVPAEARMALGPLESDFDMQEVIDALNNETQAIADITEDLKVRIEEKITKIFEILQGYLGSGGSAASAQRSLLVDKMMSLLRDRVTNTLDEIRDIARDMVACPQ